MTNLDNASGGVGDMSNDGDIAAQNAANNANPTGDQNQAGQTGALDTYGGDLAPNATAHAAASPAEGDQANRQDRRDSHADQPDDELLARDPVCGKVVNKATAPAFSLPQGANDRIVYFDSEDCKRRYDRDPLRYGASA